MRVTISKDLFKSGKAPEGSIYNGYEVVSRTARGTRYWVVVANSEGYNFQSYDYWVRPDGVKVRFLAWPYCPYPRRGFTVDFQKVY